MSFRTSASPARRVVVAASLAVTAAATVAAAGGGTALASPINPNIAQAPIAIGHTRALHSALAAPPTTATCQANYGINCYSPVQYRARLRHARPLQHRRHRPRRAPSRSSTSFGSPTIAHDLQLFDTTYRAAEPAVAEGHRAGGCDPAVRPEERRHGGWAWETTLDVEYAHAMAPDANILLVETPVAETEGVTGLPGDRARPRTT